MVAARRVAEDSRAWASGSGARYPPLGPAGRALRQRIGPARENIARGGAQRAVHGRKWYPDTPCRELKRDQPGSTGGSGSSLARELGAAAEAQREVPAAERPAGCLGMVAARRVAEDSRAWASGSGARYPPLGPAGRALRQRIGPAREKHRARRRSEGRPRKEVVSRHPLPRAETRSTRLHRWLRQLPGARVGAVAEAEREVPAARDRQGVSAWWRRGEWLKIPEPGQAAQGPDTLRLARLGGLSGSESGRRGKTSREDALRGPSTEGSGIQTPPAAG